MPLTASAILEIGVVLLLAAGAGWAMRRIGLPAVIGYLGVGLLVSPFTPGYVADRQHLQLFADIGVVLLLFEVGIEIDPFRLGRDQRRYLWVVPLHTVAVTALAASIATVAGLGWKGGSIVGLAIALSSGLVVVNITRSRRRTTNAATDQALLAWSVIQDITGVALAAAVFALIGLGDRPAWLALVQIFAFAGLAMLASAALPPVLRRVVDQPDLFLVVTVALGLTLSALGDLLFGLPLALAAFVGGLAISEGPITQEARRRLLPFRDVFAVLFFVAVGSLIDPAAVPRALPWIGLVLALVLILKGGSIYGLGRLLRQPGVSVRRLAIGLAEIGELSFVLGSLGTAEGLIGSEVYTALLSSVVVTIMVSTVWVRRAGTGT